MGSAQSGTQFPRYQGQSAADVAEPYKKVVAVESPPTDVLHCIKSWRRSSLMWIVKVPAGVTGVTVKFGRWVQSSPGKGMTTLDGWVEEGELVVPSGNVIVPKLMRGDGDVGAYVSTAAGIGSGTPVELYYQFRNDPPPAG